MTSLQINQTDNPFSFRVMYQLPIAVFFFLKIPTSSHILFLQCDIKTLPMENLDLFFFLWNLGEHMTVLEAILHGFQG